MMVPAGGLEPPHLSAGDFESPLSTNSNTQAQIFYPDIVITRLSRLNNQQHFNYINNLHLKAINFESVVYTNFTIPALCTIKVRFALYVSQRGTQGQIL